MERESLESALQREHREVDREIEAFASALRSGVDPPGEERAAGLQRAMEALRRHIYVEEEHLFPPLSGQGGMMAPLFVMLREHGELWRSLAELGEGLGRGAEAGTLLACLEDLARRLESHNSKEESVVYPQAELLLPEEDRAELQRLLAAAEMPEGWACQRAGA